MAIEMLNQVINQDAIGNQCQELAALLTRHTDSKGNGFHKTEIDKLEFMRESFVPAALHGVYQPVLGIVIQGKKEALLGEETYRYGQAQYLVVSVELPISGFVVEATPWSLD
ncbi:AraC family transcriptional regulator [Microcoleus sp. Pol12B4]|uniref:AraC family transcriptional regulator n=1 Tax=Microcoleus sp. Pol12B4 TaxID=3055395 RepID=UPI002FD3D110